MMSPKWLKNIVLAHMSTIPYKNPHNIHIPYIILTVETTVIDQANAFQNK